MQKTILDIKLSSNMTNKRIPASQLFDIAKSIIQEIDVFPPFTGGVTLNDVTREEDLLGLPITGSYRAFIVQFGSQQDEGFEGIDKINGNRISERAKLFWDDGLPKYHIPVFCESNKGYSLNTQEPTTADEFRAYQFRISSPASTLEPVAESFAELIIKYFDIEKKVLAQLNGL
ncbi:MAG: hypothetical protein U0930_01330 [Pirellulales bacterium]